MQTSRAISPRASRWSDDTFSEPMSRRNGVRFSGIPGLSRGACIRSNVVNRAKTGDSRYVL
jgi:hypothetical protein